MTVNSENQLMTIGGILCRVDVDTKNTVLSSAITDEQAVSADGGLSVSLRGPISGTPIDPV